MLTSAFKPPSLPWYRFQDKPVYLSMLRDPISRLESHFFFMRNGDADMSREEVLQSLGPRSALPNEVINHQDEILILNTTTLDPFYVRDGSVF